MGELPAGTVTFLFTEDKPNRHLWERHPDWRESAVARHAVLVADLLEYIQP